MSKLLKVEMHCHSVYSKDGWMSPEKLIELSKKLDIDRLAITDHNSIQGALAAKKLASERIIIGEEVMTTKGEILGYFMKEEIPAGLEPEEVISRMREQGAFISLAHPFDLQRHGWEMQDLMDIFPKVDAIEVFNSRCLFNSTNQAAARFAAENDLPGTVGSDAHIAYELGRSTLRLPFFSNAEELKSVIRQGIPQTAISPFWVHFGSTFAKIWKRFNKKQP